MSVQLTEPVAATRQELLAGLEALNTEEPRGDIQSRDARPLEVGAGDTPEFPPAVIGRAC